MRAFKTDMEVIINTIDTENYTSFNEFNKYIENLNSSLLQQIST